jgi:hypothetical protein
LLVSPVARNIVLVLRNSHVTFDRSRRFSARNSELDPTEVRPFGAAGVGLLTGHPVGLVVVAGVIVMVMAQLPEARWFFGGSLVLGAAIGLVLWLRHR